MRQEERMKNMQASFEKRLKEAAESHSDIKVLLDDYKELEGQKKWSKDFLDGYMACISDLIIVKKML